MSDFQDALKFILLQEGGFTPDNDALPGAAMYGIEQQTYDEFREKLNAPQQLVDKIMQDEVYQIYHEMFWLKAGCDRLPDRLSLIHFDTAVQRSPVKAIKMLQRILRTKDDGIFGPKTEAIVSVCNVGSVAKIYLRDRLDHYVTRISKRPDDLKFWNGWINRLIALKAETGIIGAVVL